jgi:hypothetical protein
MAREWYGRPKIAKNFDLKAGSQALSRASGGLSVRELQLDGYLPKSYYFG